MAWFTRMASFTRLAPPVALLLALGACGGSDDDGDSAGTSPQGSSGTTASAGTGTFLTGGASCESGGATVAGPVDGDGGGAQTGDGEPAAPDPVAADGTGACAASPTDLPSTGLPPTGGGTVSFEGREHGLDSAILLSFDDEAGAELILHDGETRVARSEATSGDSSSRGVAYGVYDAGVALSFTLVPPGPDDGLADRVYELVPGDGFDGTPTGDAIAVDALLVVDADGDGTVSSAAELAQPTSGRIVWSGPEDEPSLSFNFVLEDGRSIEGVYEGGYELID